MATRHTGELDIAWSVINPEPRQKNQMVRSSLDVGNEGYSICTISFLELVTRLATFLNIPCSYCHIIGLSNEIRARERRPTLLPSTDLRQRWLITAIISSDQLSYIMILIREIVFFFFFGFLDSVVTDGNTHAMVGLIYLPDRFLFFVHRRRIVDTRLVLVTKSPVHPAQLSDSVYFISTCKKHTVGNSLSLTLCLSTNFNQIKG